LVLLPFFPLNPFYKKLKNASALPNFMAGNYNLTLLKFSDRGLKIATMPNTLLALSLQLIFTSNFEFIPTLFILQF